MAHSSILGGQRAATTAPGRSTDVLGPSDSSDSGSDIQGELPFATGVDGALAGALPVERNSDSDSAGTGERASAVPSRHEQDGADISPDHLERIGATQGELSLDDVGDLALDDDEEIDPDAEEDDLPH
jgi:hypothetical protein